MTVVRMGEGRGQSGQVHNAYTPPDIYGYFAMPTAVFYEGHLIGLLVDIPTLSLGSVSDLGLRVLDSCRL